MSNHLIVIFEKSKFGTVSQKLNSYLDTFYFRSLRFRLNLQVTCLFSIYKYLFFYTHRVRESPPASGRKNALRGEPRTAAKCNRPILTTKAYHVCRPLGPPHLPLSLLSLSLLACDEIFIVPGPGLRDTRSCETVPIYSPTNLSRRGRHGASNKSPQKRENVVWVLDETSPRTGGTSPETWTTIVRPAEIDSSAPRGRRDVIVIGRWLMQKRETRCKIEGNRDAYLV